MRGVTQYRQELFESAQRTFLKCQDLLERYPQGCDEQEKNTYFLKIVNNLAACFHKRNQNTEALHLLKSLSTAQGNFGQIISHNIQACAT